MLHFVLVVFVLAPVLTDGAPVLSSELSNSGDRAVFSAMVTQTIVGSGTDWFRRDPIPFDRTDVDTANGYDQSTGRYTITRDGVYSFQVSCSSAHGKHLHLEAMVKTSAGTQIAMASQGRGNQDGMANVVVSLPMNFIRSLSRGDEVYVMWYYSFGDGIAANMCSFTGIQLL